MNQDQSSLQEYEKTLIELEQGKVRSAFFDDQQGKWIANIAVKKNILEAFKNGRLIQHHEYIDKHNLLPRSFTLNDGVRIVPQGSAVRRGAYVAKGVIIMPPSYINVGAYVDEGTMVDSHVLVGSCAQIGKHVHLSAGVQIGGVLEPVGESPVVIEDHAFIGAGCIIVEGIQVGAYAVLAPGVKLSKSLSVYDMVHEKILPPGSPIPRGAVVVPGTRPSKNPWAKKEGLQLYCPVIIKYRDEKSNASLVLEEALR